jgi:predicted MFS family arabinose efflux permease
MQLFYGTFHGWRLAFALVASASIMLAFAIFFFMPEPPRRQVDTLPTIGGEIEKLRRYLRIPTFRVIVLQGLFGCIPWSALSFTIFYFQYVGISDFGASFLFALCMGGGAIGGVVGGYVGDYLAKLSPLHGRAICAQISVFAGIPLIFIVFAGIPRAPEYYNTYAIMIFSFGVMASWCSSGVNRPILAEIVEEGDRASVFAWLITIDGSFAALLGAPMVGFLAENVFGYHPSQQIIANMAPGHRHINADALGHALLWCCILPWVLCLICFSFLHVTYGKDIGAISERKKLLDTPARVVL